MEKKQVYFIINGTETTVEVEPTDIAINVALTALAQVGAHGRSIDEYHILSNDQTLHWDKPLLDQVNAEDVIFLSLKAGVGGENILHECITHPRILCLCKDGECKPSQPSEQKLPEGGSDLRIIIRNTLGRVYDRKFPTTREEKDIEYATNILTEAMQEFAQQSRQQTINEALDCFDSVFMIEPVPANILLIMEAFKQGFQKLETLKQNP